MPLAQIISTLLSALARPLFALGRPLLNVITVVVATRVVKGAVRKGPQRASGLGKPDSTGGSTVSAPNYTDPHSFYPGDFMGLPPKQYAPNNDNQPDPGEVIWAWVPYEEDWARGKDRPVLIVGADNGWLLGLPLSSVDHNFDKRQEERAGRHWVEVGTGPWDSALHDSFARVDRVVRINPATVRRIGGHVSPDTFKRVYSGLRSHWND